MSRMLRRVPPGRHRGNRSPQAQLRGERAAGMTNAAREGYTGPLNPSPSQSMPKTPPHSKPDPIEREVDRLLAQLNQVGPGPAHHPGAPRHGVKPPTARPRSTGVAPSTDALSHGDVRALWWRVLLGVTLGVAMTQWPYPHGCGVALLGYLGAVGMVLLTGAWIGFASWKLRSGLTHILSLILLYWGIVLAAEQILPRIGYAADRASWRCSAALSVPSF
jgi:hypothetical protein